MIIYCYKLNYTEQYEKKILTYTITLTHTKQNHFNNKYLEIQNREKSYRENKK